MLDVAALMQYCKEQFPSLTISWVCVQLTLLNFHYNSTRIEVAFPDKVILKDQLENCTQETSSGHLKLSIKLPNIIQCVAYLGYQCTNLGRPTYRFEFCACMNNDD